MKTQTVEEMINAGATEEEAKRAFGLFELLRPGLRIKQNGRVNTTGGDKTPLGLYRTIMRPENYEPKTEKLEARHV